MNYPNIRQGIFLSRPNRFIAHILVDGKEEICHVKNTGRCRELLLPGARIYVQEQLSTKRKTKYDLISVYKATRLVNMDSQVPNKLFREWAEGSLFFGEESLIRPEYRFGRSRFDFYIESGPRKILIEVKGVTLEEEGVASFPDAPTVRGVKHIRELQLSMEEGLEAYVFFVIQMNGIRYFTPNWRTHPEFGDALVEAAQAGVKVLALECRVGEDWIEAEEFVAVNLESRPGGVIL